MNKTFQIFNTQADSNLIVEFTKNGDGALTFPTDDKPASLQENRTAVGFCVTPDPFTTMEGSGESRSISLSSLPMGLAGYLDLWDGETEVQSFRYENLKTMDSKFDWLDIITNGMVTARYEDGLFIIDVSHEGFLAVRFRDEDIRPTDADFYQVVDGEKVTGSNPAVQCKPEGAYLYFTGIVAVVTGKAYFSFDAPDINPPAGVNITYIERDSRQ